MGLITLLREGLALEMRAEACPSGWQSSDPRGRSLAGPPSTPGVCVATLAEEVGSERPRLQPDPARAPEEGRWGCLPRSWGRLPVPRPRFQALKDESFNCQNPRRQALWSPHRTCRGTEASEGRVAALRPGSEAGGRLQAGGAPQVRGVAAATGGLRPAPWGTARTAVPAPDGSDVHPGKGGGGACTPSRKIVQTPERV